MAIQKFSCIAIKVLTVSGISITSSLGVALVLPLALILVMVAVVAVGFRTFGVIVGSCAAGCQSKIGNVEAGSCFAGCQSLGALGLRGLYRLYGLYQRPLFLFIWIASSVLVGYLIWGLY